MSAPVSWVLTTPAFTTYLTGRGALELDWRPGRDGELVPCVIVGGHRFELEPGSTIRPATPAERRAG